MERLGIKGLDEDRAGLGSLEGRELLHRSRSAVVLDEQLVEHARVGPAGADASEVFLSDLDGLLHLLFGLEEGPRLLAVCVRQGRSGSVVLRGLTRQ